MSFFNILKEVISTKAYASRSWSADPLQAFKFRVSISGIPSQVGFQKISGLSEEAEVVTYLENMFDEEHKLPGRVKVGEITFTRGAYADAYLENAFREAFTEKSTRRDVTINIMDRYGNIRRTFSLAECWFSKFEEGDLDSTSSDVLIETLTMQFEKFV